ncbi:MAG TPA: protein kinase [Polyangiaceae bacterium]
MTTSWEEGSPDWSLPPIIGPYRTGHMLGRGGMGVVCRGVHQTTGNAVALKTIREVRDSMVAGIRREIHALRQLDHPAVVKVIDHGVIGGLPWYAMPLLTGSTLRGRIREVFATNGGASQAYLDDATLTTRLEEIPMAGRARHTPTVHFKAGTTGLLAVMHGVCQALAHLHENGVVHRDLKPENIFVQADDSPVVVDFGIASRFGGLTGREQVEVPDYAVGTIAYVAPEQIRGELVDARADLYALGCILYECVTGEPPFAGVASEGIIHGHLHRRPLPPSEVVDGVPESLNRLIVRLLEKRPEDRLGYADEISRAISEHCRGRSPTTERGSTTPYLYRPAFVGRKEGFGLVEKAIRSLADAHQGSAVYLGGESGVGKTRMIIEAIFEAKRRDVRVVSSQCARLDLDVERGEHDAAPLTAFGPLFLAASDHCRNHPDDTLRLLHPDGRLLVGFEPSLATVPGFSSLPEIRPVDPTAARNRLQSALLQLIIGLAEVRPLLFVIDDLQWADELSVSVLQQLAAPERIRQAPMILGTYRRDEANPSLLALLQMPGGLDIQLERFQLADVGGMICGMLALDAAPPALVAFLQEKCNGNPIFVVEYLRAAIGEGLLTRKNGSWQLGPQGDIFDFEENLSATPAGVEELVKRRLRRLDESGQRLIQAASVLGREFDVELLRACMELSDDEAQRGLALLHKRQLLEEAGNGALRFVHDAIREGAYEELPASESEQLHRRAAGYLEPRSEREPKLSRTVAHHFAKAGVAGAAATHYGRAAEHAKRHYANDDAIRLYHSALSQLSRPSTAETNGSTELFVRHSEGLADLLCMSGMREESRGHYHGALQRAQHDPLSSARLERKHGKAWELDGEFDRAKECYLRGEQELQRSGQRDGAWTREWLDIQLDHIWANYWTANLPEMQRLISGVGEAADVHGTPIQRAQFYHSFTLVRARAERYQLSEETLGFARRAMDAGEESGDPTQIALIRFGLGFALLFANQLAEAESTLQAAAAEAKLIGDRALHSRVLTYLMLTFRRRGQVEATSRLAELTGEVARKTRMKDYIGAAQANLGWALLEQDKLEEAERLLEEAVAAWTTPPAIYPFEWLALFPLLKIRVEREDLTGSLAIAERLLRTNQQKLPNDLARKLQVTQQGATEEVTQQGAAEEVRIAQLRDALVDAVNDGYL